MAVKDEDIKDCEAALLPRENGRQKKGRISATAGNSIGKGKAAVSKFGNKSVWLRGSRRERL